MCVHVASGCMQGYAVRRVLCYARGRHGEVVVLVRQVVLADGPLRAVAFPMHCRLATALMHRLAFEKTDHALFERAGVPSPTDGSNLSGF